jgi:hypothetical protein
MHATCIIHHVLVGLTFILRAISMDPADVPARAQPPSADAQDTITVHLASGRTMTALIDARTDAAQLWLRWESPNAEVLRPIGWQYVAAAEINGQKVTGKEFLDMVTQIRHDVPAQPEVAPRISNIVMRGSPQVNAPESSVAPDHMRESKVAPVRYLVIEAAPARWDQYCDTEGMSVLIAPKDAYGRIVPVRGTLDVDLIAEHAGVVRLPDPFRRIAHWSRAVHPEDFGPSGAVYKLPFQDVNPEFSNHLGPHGAVHAVLSVPGEDTFEVTVDARIRPYSLIRDRLMQTTGRRFFPEETIGPPWERK